MRALFVFVILQLVVVRGDARFRRENDQPQLDVERRGFHGRQENGPLGAMMAPRADPGAVASEICGFLGGEISTSHIFKLRYSIFGISSLEARSIANKLILIDQPWVCAVDTNYCVIEPIEGVIGCCYSNYCGAFRTACFAQTDPCDSACSSNPQNLVWYVVYFLAVPQTGECIV
jgi:hypothetical protein